MIADLKPYAEYKESGLPWLGKVPGHWAPTKLKHAFSRIIGGSTPASGNAKYWNGDVTWVTPTDVSRSKRIRRSIRQISRAGRASCSTQLVPIDSIILTTRAPVGNVSIADVELCTNQGCKALIPDSKVIAPMFGFWLLSVMKAEIQSLSTGTTFSEVSTTRLGSTFGILPPPAEQAAIVRFLEWANGRLERAIRAKRKVIALLGEQKQAIIHRAVTRGLDPSVPLKPSGIPWLVDIPQHWEVRRLKFEMLFRGGGTPSKGNAAYWNGAIPWVSPKDMKSEVIHDAEDHITERAVAESSTNLVPAGSLLMVVRSGILQRALPVARCTREVALNQDMKALTSRGRLDLDFFVLFIRGCEAQLLREWTKQGATVESVEHQYLANTKVPLPPMQEQRLIVERMDVETEPLKTAISRLEREIELLREYRTRLVADVVTGKLDVREAALHLPDEPPPDTVEDDADLNPDPDTSDEEAAQ
jgi:type I restriction enzyme S subunit